MDIFEKLETLRRQHYECEDGWYSCPLCAEGSFDYCKSQTECDCGASKHNARLDEIIEYLRHCEIAPLTTAGKI